jgi:hypothetical protein
MENPTLIKLEILREIAHVLAMPHVSATLMSADERVRLIIELWKLYDAVEIRPAA